MSRSWSRWHTNIFPQPSSSPFLPLLCSLVCIFQAVNCPHLRRQYMFNEFFSCICIGFSEFNKPAMCKISHSHFSPSCCLYCLFEQSTAHISFWVRFAILWVDWKINNIFLTFDHSLLRMPSQRNQLLHSCRKTRFQNIANEAAYK